MNFKLFEIGYSKMTGFTLEILTIDGLPSYWSKKLWFFNTSSLLKICKDDKWFFDFLFIRYFINVYQDFRDRVK